MAEAQNIPQGPAAGSGPGGPPTGRVQTTGSIAVAAESTVATRMSAPPSFDVADFPVPHGREEEWRFTPLERLRGLHDGTAEATGTVKVEVVGARRGDRRDRGPGRRAHRPGRQAGGPGRGPGVQLLREGDGRHGAQGGGADRAGAGDPARRGRRHLRTHGLRASAPSPRRSSSSTTPATPCAPPTSSSSSATAPS